jgi:hypothetical protein
MEQPVLVSKLEKIKAVAISFVGTGIFTRGITYFSPQRNIEMPRILYPVYELFGAIGLAIGMLVLGLGLLFWGYKKWIANSGATKTFLAIGVLAFLIFGGVLFYESNKSKNPLANTKEAIALDDIDSSDFENKLAVQYTKEFKTLYASMEKSLEQKDKPTFDATDQKISLWFTKSAQLTMELKDDERDDFSLLIIKLGDKYQEWRNRMVVFDKK